ncbi:MAG: DNA repair protein RadC [Parcubacteria group bacterium]|nr:DNA repair protein RadC [Parcubacteria group bacterium]
MKIKDLPKFERPREKLIKKGAAALHKAELLAILLRTGIKGKNVLQMANDILLKYGNEKLTKVSYQELRNMRGIGPTKAVQILAALELGKRIYKTREEKDVYINSPDDVVKEVNYISENKKENFITLYLDAKNHLIHKETISIGTLNASLVHPREVFEPATKHLAAQIIVVHNHPSGNSEPSEDDLEITRKLVKAGKILGIDVADHIIITKTGFISFKEKNLI